MLSLTSEPVPSWWPSLKSNHLWLCFAKCLFCAAAYVPSAEESGYPPFSFRTPAFAVQSLAQKFIASIWLQQTRARHRFGRASLLICDKGQRHPDQSNQSTALPIRKSSLTRTRGYIPNINGGRFPCCLLKRVPVWKLRNSITV